MRLRLKLILILIISVLLYTLKVNAEPCFEKKTFPSQTSSLSMNMDINKQVYFQGEPICARVSIKNITDHPLKEMWLTYPVRLKISLYNVTKDRPINLELEMQRIWILKYETPSVLKLNEIATTSFVLSNLRYEDNDTYGPQLFDDLEVGTYRIAVTQTAYLKDSSNPETVCVTREFTIRQANTAEKSEIDMFNLNGYEKNRFLSHSNDDIVEAYTNLCKNHQNSSLVPYALYKLGRISSSKGDYGDSIEIYKKILCSYPNFWLKGDLLYNYAFALYRSGNIDDAKKILLKLDSEYKNYVEMPFAKKEEKGSGIENLHKKLANE